MVRTRFSASPYNYVFGLLLMVAVTQGSGCGKKSKATWVQSEDSYTETLKSVLNAAPLYCDGECPENIGVIAVSADSYFPVGNVSRCTGFLIAPNIVATNSHCIDEVDAADCTKVLAIKFPSSSKEAAQTFACKRVLQRSSHDIRKKLPDHAYFEIEPTSRTPFAVSKSGIPDGLKVQVVSADSIDRGLGTRMIKRSCETVQGSVLSSQYHSPWSETAFALGCEMLPGHSGSPVIDSGTLAVVGILQAGASPEKLRQEYNALREKIDLPDLSNLGNLTFTNLSCIPDAVTGLRENQAACDEAKGAQPKDDKLSASSAKEVERRVVSWTERLSPVMLYRIGYSMKETTTSFWANPLCLRPMSDWPKDVLANRQETGSWWSKTSHFQIRHEGGLTLVSKPKIDSRLRYRGELDIEETLTGFQLTLALGGNETGSEIEQADYRSELGRVGLVSFPWAAASWCSAEQLKAGSIMEDGSVK
jgi:hypothetical protein